MLHGKLLIAAATLLIVARTPPFDSAQGRAVAHAQARPLNSAQEGLGEWPALSAIGARNAPEYVRLFAPRRAHAGAYQAYVSPLDLDTVLRRLEQDPSLLHPPGAWTPSALLPSDAFGQTGSYDRSKMARLYGARRAMVARGPTGQAGRPIQAWTLISPYPDRGLERLEPGTLLIVLRLATD